MSQLNPSRIQEYYFDEDSQEAPNSPWGRAAYLVQYDGNNLGEACNGGHGGMFVRGKWAKKIPEFLRQTWYEEHDAVSIPWYYLYDELKALREAIGDNPMPYYHSLGMAKLRTKEQLFQRIRKSNRAAFDVHEGVKSTRDCFEYDYEYEQYLADYQALVQAKEVKARQKLARQSIKAGAVVEFKTPLQFCIDGEKVALSKFIVEQYRKRTFRFRPASNEHTFLAKIVNWQKMDFTVVA